LGWISPDLQRTPNPQEQPPKVFGVATQVRPNYGAGLYSRFGDFGSFLERNYQTNSNYRFVEMCVQRILGRDVYSEREKIAWSIVVANKGPQGFIDELVNSDEYLEKFGYDTIPYQQRRILPQRVGGDTPFNLKTPRYDEYHRSQLGFPQIIWQTSVRRFVPQEQQPKAGDPSNYLGMARNMPIPTTPPQRVPLANINIDSMVPRRR
jgi:phycobilisome rod-core linker protein